MKELNPRDKRQLILMQEVLDKPSLSFLTISHLLNDLNALMGELEHVDHLWKEDFSSKWWVIEDLYAHSLDKSKSEFTQEHALRVQESLEHLREMVDDKLREYADIDI